MNDLVHVGVPTTPVPILGIQSGASFCESSLFNVYTGGQPAEDNAGFVWDVSPGSIFSGQGSTEAYIQLPGGYSYANEYDIVDGFVISLQGQNSCGVSNWESTISGNILGCGGGGISTAINRSLVSANGVGLNNTGLGVYPNPADNIVNIIVPGGMDVANANITLSDIYGRQLKRITTVSSNNTFDLSGLAAGIYLVQVYDGKKTVATRKVIKK